MLVLISKKWARFLCSLRGLSTYVEIVDFFVDEYELVLLWANDRMYMLAESSHLSLALIDIKLLVTTCLA